MKEAPTSARKLDTPWRQGKVLSAHTAERFNLRHNQFPDETCVMVISHDCDVINRLAEPYVEVIVGRTMLDFNGNYLYGKSPRTLHLPISSSELPVMVELAAQNKALVDKQTLFDASPDSAYQLEAKHISILRSWLASRYRRAAFPDAVIERMQRSTKLDSSLGKVLASYRCISAVYFDIDQGEQIERAADAPYELSIVLAYDPGDEPDDAADAAENAAELVENLFEKECFKRDTQSWQHFKIRKCVAISEQELPVSRARMLSEWRIDHISFRGDNPESGITPFAR